MRQGSKGNGELNNEHCEERKSELDQRPRASSSFELYSSSLVNLLHTTSCHIRDSLVFVTQRDVEVSKWQ